jgi:hypothetical protein
MAKETIFPAAEGEVGHGRGDANVDADVSRRSFVAESARRRAAGSEKRRLIAKRILLQKIHGLIQIFCVNQAKHGAKNLRMRKFAVSWHRIENGGLHEIAGLIAGNFRVAPVD